MTTNAQHLSKIAQKDIIAALEQNYLFWSLYWAKSMRGGHYRFNDHMVQGGLKGFTTNTRDHEKA